MLMKAHMKPWYLCPNKYANGGTHEPQYLCQILINVI